MNRALTAVLLALLTITIGCGKAQPPTSPDAADRSTQDFLDFATLFGDVVTDPNWHDVALGGVTGGPRSLMAGYPVSIPPGYSTVAVSLKRWEGAHGTVFTPYWRWLMDDGSLGEYPADPVPVASRDYPDPNEDYDYRFPKVEGMYCGGVGDQAVIQIAVCYQVRHFALGNWGDWDIGVTVLTWDLEHDDFPEDGPFRYEVIIEKARDQRHPDLAFDWGADPPYYYGGLYVVYEDVEGWMYPVHLKFRFFSRLDHDSRYRLVLGPPYPTELLAQVGDHDGYTPSVDLGQLWELPTRWLAIAYTAQYWDMEGEVLNNYIVCLSAWDADNPPPGGDMVSFELRNELYGYKNAGLPCLDMSPCTLDDYHFGAVAFVQEVGEDGYGPIARVYEIDSYNVNRFTPISADDPNLADGLFPSIMLYTREILGIPTPFASMTFMAQTPEDDLYHPRGVNLEINMNPGEPHPDPDWNEYIGIYDITGNHNLSYIPFLDPGVATAIVPVSDDGNYWAAWCNRMEMEEPPTTVEGAWGSTR